MRFRKHKDAHTEAEVAIHEANKHLEEVKSRDEEVREVASALREIRNRNHFAEQIQLLMRRKA